MDGLRLACRPEEFPDRRIPFSDCFFGKDGISSVCLGLSGIRFLGIFICPT